jgi:hypothetical protein
MWMRGALGLAFLSALGGPVRGENMGTLLRRCERFQQIVEFRGNEIKIPRDIDAAMCFGYVSGVMDLIYLVDDADKSLLSVCAPEGTSVEQLVQIFVNFARSRPEKWHEQARLGMMASLWAAFPCRKS